MSRTHVITSIALTALAAACGGGYSGTTTQPGGTGNPPAQSATVDATASNAFTPQTVSLAVGGTVTFAFGTVGHSVYFDNAPAGAPTDIAGVNANVSTSRSFPTAGTFEYNCHIHPGMKGTVVVGSASTPPTGGGTTY